VAATSQTQLCADRAKSGRASGRSRRRRVRTRYCRGQAGLQRGPEAARRRVCGEERTGGK
ncbi:unnamed protein product, partial [Amoebophrya sp. A120]